MNTREVMQSGKLSTPWRILLALLSMAGGLAGSVGFEVDRTIRHYYFSDFSPWHPQIGDLLLILGVLYFLLVSITGRWRLLASRGCA